MNPSSFVFQGIHKSLGEDVYYKLVTQTFDSVLFQKGSVKSL